MILSGSSSTIDFSRMEFIPECDREFPIACYEYDLCERAEPWHWHDQFEIALIDGGDAVLSIEGTEYTVAPGEGYFVNSGALHSLFGKGGKSSRVRCVVFSKELVGGFSESVFWRKYLLPLTEQEDFFGCVLAKDSGWQEKICACVNEIFSACKSEADMYEIRVRELATEIIALAADSIKNHAAGGEAEYWHLNASVESECADVLAKVVEKFGKLDILVNNAGITDPDVPTEEVEEAGWDKMFAINVKSVLFMTKHAIKYLRANGKGSIVNTSSVSGLIGDTELTPYHATKGTIVVMTMKDAIQYAPDHIRVNCVCPGTVMTPLVKGLLEDDPHYLDNDIKRYPLGYFGEPDDVAYGVLFLASDEGRFVTGTKLVIDGGYTAQ